MATKGLHRAMRLLTLVAERPGRASELAERMDVPWATMHRTLTGLENGGFLTRDPDTGRYTIGQSMWTVGSAYLAGHRVLSAALPYLSDAVTRSQAIVQLVERIGGQAVAVFSQSSTHEMIPLTTLGHSFPLHCGSKGQVLLAHAGTEFIERYLAEPLAALTPNSVTDPDTLRELLAAIRASGFARTEADVQTFTRSVAAPVRSGAGQVVASVCFIEMRAQTGGADRDGRLRDLVISTAASISAALDWRVEARRTGSDD
jgi:DNA-binding IclR family transcriptional regulator